MNDKISKTFIKKIMHNIKLNKTMIAYGAEKKCHLFPNVVAFSQNVKGYSSQEVKRKLLLSLIKKKNTDRLILCGINTPKILDIKLINNEILEVQERALGRILCYTNESNMLSTFENGNEYYSCFKDMPDYYRKEFFDKILKYHISMQKQLKAAPISHYMKFLQDFKAIEEYGISLDVHGENFLYHSSDGFSFIDLPSIQSVENKKFDFENVENASADCGKKLERNRKISDVVVVYQVCNILADYLKFAGNVYSNENVRLIKRNNSQIIKKIFLASKKIKYKISDKEYEQILKLCKNFIYQDDFENKKTLD